MTRDDIIRMAREAGLHELHSRDRNGLPWLHLLDVGREEVIRFAALVAAAEREACAQVCESLAGSMWVTREASLECSDAIRARGQA